MLSPTALFFAASLAALASVSAQNFEIPAGFNAGIVPDSDKTSWCQGQLTSCPKICPDGIASKNTCNPSTLSFNCVCGDGSTPNVAEYRNTLPFFVCEENFGQCINAHPNDLAGQKDCKSQRAQYCGTKKVPTDDDDDDETTATTSSSSASKTAATSHASSDFDESSAAASGTTLASKTRTTASATGKTAAKSPSTATATGVSAEATESSAAGVVAGAPYGAGAGAAAALLAIGLF
ncbi:hypothetical protein KEM56_000333 [Ascosphaera pollenicola]|nr:hypothetical protein KEM56_000333 [Ascosphaera pollenicola]